MKSEEILALFERFEQAATEVNGIECWSARALCPVLGYSQWRNFLPAIEKAKESCKAAGEAVSDHFADVRKMIDIAKGAQREIDDILLTRYACYLIAKDLYGVSSITDEHVDNNIAVREMLRSRGIEPARLQPAEDVNKVERRLKAEEKKALPKKK